MTLCVAIVWAFWPGNASTALAFLRIPQSSATALGAPAGVDKPTYTPTFTPTFTSTLQPSVTAGPVITLAPVSVSTQPHMQGQSERQPHSVPSHSSSQAQGLIKSSSTPTATPLPTATLTMTLLTEAPAIISSSQGNGVTSQVLPDARVGSAPMPLWVPCLGIFFILLGLGLFAVARKRNYLQN